MPAALDRHGEALETADGARCGDTCHVDVIDRWGNIVAAVGWLVPIEPGDPGVELRIDRAGSDVLVARGAGVVACAGSAAEDDVDAINGVPEWQALSRFRHAGGNQQEQLSLAFLLRHIHHGMDLQAATNAPGFHTDDLVASFWPREVAPGPLTLEGRMPAATTGELRRRGHAVTIGDDLVGGPSLRVCPRSRWRCVLAQGRSKSPGHARLCGCALT